MYRTRSLDGLSFISAEQYCNKVPNPASRPSKVFPKGLLHPSTRTASQEYNYSANCEQCAEEIMHTCVGRLSMEKHVNSTFGVQESEDHVWPWNIEPFSQSIIAKLFSHVNVVWSASLRAPISQCYFPSATIPIPEWGSSAQSLPLPCPTTAHRRL